MKILFFVIFGGNITTEFGGFGEFYGKQKTFGGLGKMAKPAAAV